MRGDIEEEKSGETRSEQREGLDCLRVTMTASGVTGLGLG